MAVPVLDVIGMTKLGPRQFAAVVRNRPKNSRVLGVNLPGDRSTLFGAHVFAVGRTLFAFPASRQNPVPDPPRNFPFTDAALIVPPHLLTDRHN